MKSLHATICFALILTCCTPEVGADGQKIEFWQCPRKGANYFNEIPHEQWFKDAHALGVDWVRLAYDKWESRSRDFLMGDADQFDSLVQEDLAKLMQALDWAAKYKLKVAIAPLSLPGNRWSQNNDDKDDLRLWSDKNYWRQAACFWNELAQKLYKHPAVYAYNIINEPTPEMGTGLKEHGEVNRYQDWYATHKNTTHDMPDFYRSIIEAIREVDPETPIMLDAGWYAQPSAFTYWPKLDDPLILYSFHMYEPYEFTNAGNFRKERNLVYPGPVPFAGERIEWNKEQIERYLHPFFLWAESAGIPSSRLVCGEFGCYRRNQGSQQYLADVISVLNEHKIHWAFYSFREDAWDGYDYEIGVGGLGWEYWKAKEEGENPPLPRKDNPLFDVIRREFK